MARGVAVGTAAAVTAAAIGSVVYSLPSGCGYRVINGARYAECGGVWYEQRYSGSQFTCVVAPRSWAVSGPGREVLGQSQQKPDQM